MSDLADIQQRIEKRRAEMGYDNDALQLQILLTEEVGEVSRELRSLFTDKALNIDHLSDELADVFVYLSALASKFDIDLERAIEKKFFSGGGD